MKIRPQLAACFTSAPILASAAAVMLVLRVHASLHIDDHEARDCCDALTDTATADARRIERDFEGQVQGCIAQRVTRATIGGGRWGPADARRLRDGVMGRFHHHSSASGLGSSWPL